ncbi:MAG: cytochrome C biosynthesis protein, partial [Gammaproteobacteria bacterium]
MKYLLCWFILLFPVAGLATNHDNETPQSGKPVELSFFWSRRCPHCLEARPFVQALAAKYDWLQVNS